MKNILIKSTLITLVLAISVSLNAQTKKTTNAVTGVKAKVKTSSNSEGVAGSPKSDAHLLMPEIPKQKQTVSTVEVNAGIAKGGIRGNDIIGEGEYLNFDKVIMESTINGQIPASFPKHIKGQTKQQYKIIMNDWARNNLQLIKEECRSKIK